MAVVASPRPLSRAAPAAAPAFAIRVEGLRRAFGAVDAVRGVDLEVRRGEIFGLVGPDGAGKTTLIQMLCGILDPTAGSATVLGLDTVHDAAPLGERIGYMSQVFSLYGDLSVAENIEFFADLRFIPEEQRRQRTERLLRFSRLAPFVDRLARQLSGGMQKKLALCTTLVHDPEILFLDEPTTGVDPVSRRDFWEIVFDFLREGVTVFLATPYLDEAERCQRVALMHEGRILALDTPAALKSRLGGQMAEIWTADEARALSLLRADPDVRDAQVFGRSIHALLVEIPAYRQVERRLHERGLEIQAARCIEPSLEDVFVSLLGQQEGVGTRPETTSPRPPVPTTLRSGGSGAIAVEGLSRRFGDFVAVNDLSFTIAEGEVFGFLGPNGSGKSTTIRMLTGILTPSAGTARVAGFDVRREPRRIRPILGYMSQRFSLYDDLTVGENLEFFAGLYDVPRGEITERKRWALAMVGLEAGDGMCTRDLAGGLKQRLALASAIIHRPRIVLLDEPTSGVDPLSRRKFWDLIFDLSAQGVTVLVTTHYMDEAERCHRLALLDAGRLLALGTPDELRDSIGGKLLEILVDEPLPALRIARTLRGVRQTTLYGARLHLLTEEDTEVAVSQALELAGHPVREIAPVPLAMEDVFAALVAGNEAEPARAT